MFITKSAYDKVNARNVTLAKEMKRLDEENKYLYKENRILRNEKEELQDTLEEILKLTESNKYGNAEIILNKIKEVVVNQNKQLLDRI